MKYQNFKSSGEIDGTVFATVDQVSWLGRRKTIAIFRPKYSGAFRNLDSGEWLHGFFIEDMYQAEKARKLLNP